MATDVTNPVESDDDESSSSRQSSDSATQNRLPVDGSQSEPSKSASQTGDTDEQTTNNDDNVSYHELTAFQRDTMYVLNHQEEEVHGLAIKDDLEDYYESEVGHGRLYPNLDKLADMELVEKGQIDRRTNSYEITPKGKVLLADRRNWEGSN